MPQFIKTAEEPIFYAQHGMFEEQQKMETEYGKVFKVTSAITLC